MNCALLVSLVAYLGGLSDVWVLQNALELRTYLHDRSLMKYANTLEASGRTLTELLSTSPTELTTQFKMRRGHVARFLDMGSACSIKLPSDLVLPARQVTAAHHGNLKDVDDEMSPLVPESAEFQPGSFPGGIQARNSMNARDSFIGTGISFSSNLGGTLQFPYPPLSSLLQFHQHSICHYA